MISYIVYIEKQETLLIIYEKEVFYDFIAQDIVDRRKVVFKECKSVNPNSYQIERAEEIDFNWLKGVKTIGICGATSTPKWLMEECRDAILRHP